MERMRKIAFCVIIFTAYYSLNNFAFAETSERETITIASYAFRRTTTYRLDGRALALHTRLFSRRDREIIEDRFIIFPRYGNGAFIIISINPSGRINSINSGGRNFYSCANFSAHLVCEQIRMIAMSWYFKLHIRNRINLLGRIRVPFRATGLIPYLPEYYSPYPPDFIYL